MCTSCNKQRKRSSLIQKISRTLHNSTHNTFSSPLIVTFREKRCETNSKSSHVVHQLCEPLLRWHMSVTHTRLAPTFTRLPLIVLHGALATSRLSWLAERRRKKSYYYCKIQHTKQKIKRCHTQSKTRKCFMLACPHRL